MGVGERIKARRKEIGLSAEQVAKELGVSPATVYRYESNDIMNMRIDKLEPIAKALHTTPAYLMGWEEDKYSIPSNAIPIDFKNLKRIPILGRIAAGVPIYAEENIEGYTYTDLNGGPEYFGLRVRGDSMDAAGIKDGYVVIVRRKRVYGCRGAVNSASVGPTSHTRPRNITHTRSALWRTTPRSWETST